MAVVEERKKEVEVEEGEHTHVVGRWSLVLVTRRDFLAEVAQEFSLGLVQASHCDGSRL